MSIDVLSARLEELKTEIDALAERDELTDEEEARFDEAVTEADEARAEIARLEVRARKVEEIRQFAAEGRTEHGEDRGPQIVIKPNKSEVFDLAAVRSHPLADARGYGNEMRDRALRAVEYSEDLLNTESKDRIDKLTKSAGRGQPGQVDHAAGIARHIILTGSEEYRDAFAAYMSGDPTATTRYPEAMRAAMSLTGANGGFLVPFTLDPTIILTNDGAVNPFRQISGQVSITTDDWNGVSSAGVTAEWLAEATEAADATPTFAQPSITVHKAAAYLQASIEVTMDAGVDSEIAGLIADAKVRHEATAFAVGSGSGQPVGIVTALNLYTTSRVAAQTNGSLGAIDIYALDNALGPRWRSNASFVANKQVWNTVRQLGTAVSHSFWTDFGGGLPPQLIGYPVYESSAMDAGTSTATSSTDEVVVLGDFRAGYKIVDRVGLAIAYNPLVLGSNRRPSGEVGWFAYWRVGGDSVADDAFSMLVQ